MPTWNVRQPSFNMAKLDPFLATNSKSQTQEATHYVISD